jgi:hypothetical protein
MCLGVYLAAAVPLEPITWSPERPAFNVAGLTEHEDPVRRQFSQPHIYYLGSHSRCGCGFQASGDSDPAAGERSRAALAAYVGAARRMGPAELFVCWDGAYAVAPERRLRLTAAELEAAADWTQELTFVEILEAAAPAIP